MAGYRKLPGADKLRELVAAGKSNKEIALMYGVTPEAARVAVKAAGLTPTGSGSRVDHSRFFPWRGVRADRLAQHILARRLREHSKRVQGIKLSTSENRLLDEWLEYMDGKNPEGIKYVVDYRPEHPEGFVLVPREEGDTDYIRRPTESGPAKRKRSI